MEHLPASSTERLHPLTDLPNRLVLRELLERALAQQAGRFGVLEVDLDSLKSINDEYSHAEGDEYIRAAGEILDAIVRVGDVCHKSGDEFTIILYDIADQEALKAAADRIRRTLDEYGISLSIGGRLHQNGESLVDLLSSADELLFADKVQRKLEHYKDPVIVAAIRAILTVANHHKISLRDLPLLKEMMDKEVLT